MTALRLLLVLAGVTVVVFALQRGADVRSCDDARGAAFGAALAPQPEPLPDGGRALAADVVDHCRGSEALALSARALVRIGAFAGAQRLAATAVDRDPEAFAARTALAEVLEARGRPEEAQVQRERARALNPRGPVPGAPPPAAPGSPGSGA
ncbi:hypothetical protein [Paraconexibacter algicola]|uniref:Uncharacterized protein n=1 Tax=Paraconexibacter algicola TaxID=2133960 RepID=A0A2T4UEI3_9ACTN|nr:hypothetical protein [Paraconexibacter algicola]PTL56198.1 hypothetical protein C7Y72_14520 [Paraconexibacter algicola]